MQFKSIDELGLTDELRKSIYDEIKAHIEQKVQEGAETIKLDYEKQLHSLQLDYAIEKEVSSSGARNSKAVIALIDKENLTLKNGQVPMLKQKIQELKNSPETSFLFFKDERAGFTGITPFESKLNLRKKPENMSYEELCNYYGYFPNI